MYLNFTLYLLYPLYLHIPPFATQVHVLCICISCPYDGCSPPVPHMLYTPFWLSRTHRCDGSVSDYVCTIVCPSAALVVGVLQSRRRSQGHGCASPTQHLQQKEDGHEERVSDPRQALLPPQQPHQGVDYVGAEDEEQGVRDVDGAQPRCTQGQLSRDDKQRVQWSRRNSPDQAVTRMAPRLG